MNVYERLKKRRKDLGLTMLQVAQKIGVSEGTISRWESGDIANMRRDKIVSLAKALQVHPAFIMDDDEVFEITQGLGFESPSVTKSTTTFAVIGDIAAGYDRIALESWEGDTVEIPDSYLKGHKSSDFFVLRVIGDSMYPLYHENDKVLILKTPTLEYSGQVGAVLYDGECATLKKVEFCMGEDWLKLVPINPNHPPKLIENSDLEQCKIIGIPKLLIREVKS